MTATMNSRQGWLPRAVPAGAGSPIGTLLVAFLAFIAAVLVAADVDGPVRTYVVIAALVTAPGLPIVRLLRLADPVARTVLVVVVSIGIESVLGLLMVWTRIWAPLPVAAALLLAGGWLALARGVPAARLVWGTNKRHSAERAVPTLQEPVSVRTTVQTVALSVTIAVAAVCWGIGVAGTSTDHLGEWGLLPVLPVTFWVGAALAMAGAVFAFVGRGVIRGVRVLAVGFLVVVLYLTADLVEAAPRPPWVFKHVAVTAYISAHGGVDPSIDIYNRWPGFFSASAFLGQATGHVDPLDYVKWAEVAFALVDAALVVGIARTLGLRGRWTWLAAAVFSAANWVGQSYYSPQAFAFMLYLGAVLVALAVLRGRPHAPLRWVERTVSKLFRTKAPAVVEAVPVRTRSVTITAIVVILLLQGVITASHQLTPFVLVATLAPLFVFGYLRPWWVAFPLAALPIAYVIPNLDYIKTQFGLFTGFDPVSNLTAASATFVQPSIAATLQSRGVQALTVFVAVLAILGLIRRVRQGHAGQAFVMLWLAVLPATVALGQSYGGEAKFRVILFALPALSVGVAWLFHGRVRRTVLSMVALTVMVGLFLGTTFQPEATNRTPESEVKAASWLNSRFGADDTLISVADFPSILGSDYDRYLERWGQTTSLIAQASYFPKGMTNADIYQIIRANSNGGHTWLVFSAHEKATAAATGIVSGKRIDSIEQSIASVAALRYDKDGVRVYEVDAQS